MTSETFNTARTKNEYTASFESADGSDFAMPLAVIEWNLI